MLKAIWNQRKKDEGFTLVELLIVIVILGILVAIVIFAVGGFTGTSAQQACKTDVKQLKTAASAYYAQQGSWPGGDSDLSPKYTQSLPPNSKASSTQNYYVARTYATSGFSTTAKYDDGSTAWADC